MNVHVLMGGPTAEYEVSINSGCQVVKHLLKAGHCVRAVVISADLRLYTTPVLSDPLTLEQASVPQNCPLFAPPCPPQNSAALWHGCECAFLALHGSFGEDGTIQGFLETIGVPYIGSGVGPSALAMDKVQTKCVYAGNGIDTPPFVLVRAADRDCAVERCATTLGMPCFAKCPQSGSSRLMGRAQDVTELGNLLDELLASSAVVLVEKAIAGPEFSCGVLEYPDGRCVALPPVEIRPRTATFFDYDAKYTDNATEELVPAPREDALLRRIQERALRAHTVLGCRGVSRTDMILADNTLYVLETNTLPGLTPNSILPRAFAAQGGSYTQLLEVLLSTARTDFCGARP